MQKSVSTSHVIASTHLAQVQALLSNATASTSTLGAHSRQVDSVHSLASQIVKSALCTQLSESVYAANNRATGERQGFIML